MKKKTVAGDPPLYTLFNWLVVARSGGDGFNTRETFGFDRKKLRGVRGPLKSRNDGDGNCTNIVYI